MGVLFSLWPQPNPFPRHGLKVHVIAERARPNPSPSADTLAEESALIARARATSVSNPGASLGAIDEHARRFPHGELAPEREYVRLGLLRRLGRHDEARARGQSYLGRYPSSPYVPAVKNMLAEVDAR